MLRNLAAILLFAGLSACASLPETAPPRVAKAPQGYETTRSFAAAPTEWPADRWWTRYGDAQLDALIDEALAGAPTLAQAEARLRQAEAAAGRARAAGLPSMAASGGVQTAKQSYNNGIPADFVPQDWNSYGRLTLDFAWELDFWGKNRAAVAAAASTARAAEAEVAQARLILATGIAAAYADFAQLEAERDIAARTVALQRETASLVAQRAANGLDTRGEQRQAEAEPLQAQAELAALDERIALTRNRIAALLGAGPDRGLTLTPPATAALKPFGLPASIAAELVGRRPDVIAARWRAEAAAGRAREARAAFYPNVNLAGFIGAQALHVDRLFDSGSDIGALGPAVSLPIFEGGALRTGLRGARADRDGAVATYDAVVTEAFRQVADVVASETALAVQLRDSRAALAASEDAYRIARLRYEGELSTYAALLQAEQALLLRRRRVADLEARAFSLDVALVRALGGGFQAG